jgi:His-Xaa-Ser system protein HxsD
MAVLSGLPPELVSADLTDLSATATIDPTLYPVDAVYGAAFTLIDRAYVLLDKTPAGRFTVTLTLKKAPADAQAALTALVGELANELLACAWRVKIQAENRALIESVTMRSMAGAMGAPPAPSLDDLESFDFSSEAFEDPLGIALSWEEKYGKKTPPAAGEGPPPASPEKEEPKKDEPA